MKLFLTLLLLISTPLKADVVKPALIEISFFEDKKVEVVIDLSLEAVMTGIGTQFKNTTDSPNSEQYDELRALEPAVLRERFKDFESEFLNSIGLNVNTQEQVLTLSDVNIDIIGYKKRPRKTLLTYTVQLSQWPQSFSWQYAKIYGDSALRYQMYQKDEYNWHEWHWLRDGASSGVIDINHPEPIDDVTRLIQFTSIGFDHVIPKGWDHILFIVGMALSSLLWRRLLLLVSAFTLAHTITLGLAMYGVVEISAKIIEPLIALSIAYIAIENLSKHQHLKRKTIAVFLFGLIHGLGFASMLKSFEMATENFLVTLIGFNIGVEIAQLAIVLTVVVLLLLLRLFKINYRVVAIVPISVLISIVGVYWAVERLMG